MNFKPLENELEYKNTKKWIKIFEEDIEDFKKRYKKASDFILVAEHTYYAKHILEAEVQDYEHRKRGDY